MSPIEASLTAAASGGDLAPQVYDRLFARLPQMRAEFWRDRSGSIRGEMLARAFEALLDFAGPRAFSPAYFRTELVTHDAYGIPRNLFATFFAAIAEAVKAACGDAWTADMAAAWDGLLGEIDAELATVPGLDAPESRLDPATIRPPGAGGIAFPHR